MGDGYEISTDPARLDVARIHGWLTETSKRPPGMPRDILERAMANSINFGLYHAQDGQVGFARVISDRATFAYLANMFVLRSHRGKGLSKRLMEAILAHPELRNLRRWMLVTHDTHGLYEQFGFTLPKAANHLMERVDPDVYVRLKG